MQSYTIYLIRHGAVEETNKGRYIGQTDVHLSNRGRQTLKEIAEQFGYPNAEEIYTSPLLRCIETCSIL